VLEARNISVELSGRDILRDVSVQLKKGEIVAILGANGAGKTTLIRVLNGTLPITKGTVSFDGKPLADKSRREIAGLIAIVAQENETKFPVTVLEFVLSGRFVQGGAFGWETADDLRAANAVLKSCDLAEYGNRLMNELSGGERQRVVLARAMAAESDVLLLDEPTANLDLSHQASMFRLVRSRCRELDVAAAVITHDLNLAAEFADTILLLKDGGIFSSGPTAECLTAENISAVFGVDVVLDAHPAVGRLRVTTIF